MKLKYFFISLIDLLLFDSRLFIKGKIQPGFIPKKDDLVIDLGCGDKPFWRADIYLDKLSLSNEQRFSSSNVIKNLGVFIDSDITKTPFKNKVFNFSFCSHVLEHVERPDLAIKKIVRISRMGYIEVPDGIIEMLFPFHSHLWFIYLQNNELVFVRKSKTWHQILWNNGKKYRHLLRFSKEPFIRLYWEKSIKFRVIDNLKKSEKWTATNNNRFIQIPSIQRLYLTVVKILRVLFYKEKQIELDSSW